MKYHDSIKQSQEKMSLAVQLLNQWKLPTTPINYSVAYEFTHDKNTELVSTIKQRVASKLAIDDYFIEEMHQAFILGQSKFRDEIIDDVDGVLNDISSVSDLSSTALQGFVKQLNSNMVNITSKDSADINATIITLQQAASTFTSQQSELKDQIKNAQNQTAKLKEELNEVRKEVYLDPITQLYNRKAMSNHLETWYNKNSQQQVAAIVISIDNFPHITQKFGPLLSNVLLSKIANKVTSYVDESGLPIRSSGDEFLILLPQVEQSAASEIAEKIRQGVDKLRFVSSKSGFKLPKVTISLGVSEFNITKNIHHVIDSARQILTLSENKEPNKVVIESQLPYNPLNAN